eukprot:1363809-Pyramimonas_sp.AAC.1
MDTTGTSGRRLTCDKSPPVEVHSRGWSRRVFDRLCELLGVHFGRTSHCRKRSRGAIREESTGGTNSHLPLPSMSRGLPYHEPDLRTFGLTYTHA